MAFSLETFTLAEWLAADEGMRAVVTDALLERTPPGYRWTFEVGMAPALTPQLIHQPTQVLFNVVFGGTYTFGMTPERLERAARLNRPAFEEDEPEPLPPHAAPAEVKVETFLLAETQLVYSQLTRLGFVHADIGGSSLLRRPAVAKVSERLAQHGWRLPTEHELELALRAGCDAEPALRDAPERDEHPLGLFGLGARELCEGGVVRGGGPLVDWRGRTPGWFMELAFPGRASSSDVSLVGLRPAATL